MDRFWGRITQVGDNLLPSPVRGVLMSKNANDNAIIDHVPDTHPPNWSWEINPTSTALDDYRFPQRWTTVPASTYPTVVTDTLFNEQAWSFGRVNIATPVGPFRGIQTNYTVYPDRTRYRWRTTWRFIDGFINDSRWVYNGQAYIRDKEGFGFAAPQTALLSGKTTLLWGLATQTPFAPHLHFQLKTTITEYGTYYSAVLELSAWHGNTKLAELFIASNYLDTIIDWENGTAVFYYRTDPSQSYGALAVASGTSMTNRTAFFLHRFDGIESITGGGGFSDSNVFNDAMFEPRLVRNHTQLQVPDAFVVVRTPTRTVNPNRTVRLIGVSPNIHTVRYHRNGIWYTPTYEGNQTWRVETGGSAISDFMWEVSASSWIESFRETEVAGGGSGGTLPTYSFEFHPPICFAEVGNLTIQQTQIAPDELTIRVYDGPFVLFETTRNTFPATVGVPNLATGQLRVAVYSTARQEIIYERTWWVYPCQARPERIGRFLWAIGLVSLHSHDGRTQYSQSDVPGHFKKESGIWERDIY